jgi:hypothetical protein
MTGYIYVLKDPRDGEIRYVGQTQQSPQQRLGQHKRQRIERPVGGWVNDLKGRGLQPTIEVIEEPHPERLDEREEYYIKRFREIGLDILNVLDVGKGRKGYRPPAEVRQKVSASIKERWKTLDEEEKERIISNLNMDGSAWKGRTHTEESRKKMSEAAKKRPANRKGMTNSEEHRRRISKAKKGKRVDHLLDPEAIKKVADSKRGKPRSEETKRKISESLRKRTLAKGA